MAISLTDDDAALVLGHLDGEPQAFDVLYRRYFPRLVRLCFRLTRNRATAEDAAQETLVRALDHLDRFEANRPLWPWLKTIATRVVIDNVRATSREVPVEDTVESGTGSPADTERADERFVLMEALSALPERQRDAVTLRYLEEWDGARAAEHLGVSGLAFRQILHRGRRRLRLEYRRMSEAALGAILVPVEWLRRVSGRTAARLQRVNGPATGQAIASVTAVNLVAAVAILGGAGDHRAPTPADPGVTAPPAVRMARQVDAEPKVEAAPAGPTGAGAAPETSGPAPSQTGNGGGRPVDGAAEKAEEVVVDATDPNRNVTRPEDASIVDIAHSPGEDRTVFLAGTANCRVAPCPSVLFRSTDDGASWERLEAAGFQGTQVLLPPAHPADPRIFAMGPAGLQVSEDGGRSFGPAAAGPSVATGAAAISPGFNSGDARILIGSESLLQYHDETGTVGPTDAVPGRGPLYPAFSPDYERDGLVFVGGLGTDASSGKWATPTVFTCSAAVCSGTPLPTSGQVTRVRPASDFARSGTVYAFTRNELFVSEDGGGTFSALFAEWDGPLDDIVAAGNGRILAVVGDAGDGSRGGLHASSDGGSGWSRLSSPILEPGVTGIGISGTHVLAALGAGGVACSTDNGATWAPRCPA